MTDSNTDPGRVLILAPVGRDAPVLAGMLQGAGIEADVTSDIDALVAQLDSGAGAAIIAIEALRRGDPRPLSRWIAQQPAWSDFPFVLLTHRGAANTPDLTGNYAAMLGNVTLLERPLHVVTLLSAAKQALRARSRQLQAAAQFAARERAEAEARELAQTLEQRVAERTRELADANDRLTAEIAERERTEAALAHAQKMEAIGQLTGGVAHDFNNLLTAVIGNLDLLEARLQESPLRRMVEQSLRAAERGAKLTSQLLAFSRKQRLTPMPVDVDRLLANHVDLLARTLGPSVRIETVLGAGGAPAMADATQLELAILNLAINARDAMPGGGTLRIETAAFDGSTADLAEGHWVTIAIRDDGVGMEKEILQRVFEPFFTTKETGKGSGLGLSQVYGFAKQSDGSVAIESTPGAGTTVRIVLPRAATQTATVTPLRADIVPQRPGARILVVDDDEDVRVTIVELLQQLGYRVIAAADGLTALNLLQREQGIELLLTDVAMPEINGVETARRARLMRPHLRVLFVSGYADLAQFGSDLADQDVLKKPYRLSELATRIDHALSVAKQA
ncbi:ATP-binding protein [Roseiterribacter gracilis]|uniref:histidine kinase n=1 Tax=Roseiterribacter gracilis TaxID=2812848 RepID=A0A8S8XED7_9PROT|nr:hybrid sensor histidine kinase/response regulator [Rhodospirillales bacterium TMPK1]